MMDWHFATSALLSWPNPVAGFRGYFTGSAVHMMKTELLVRTGRWAAQRWQRLSGNGGLISPGSVEAGVPRAQSRPNEVLGRRAPAIEACPEAPVVGALGRQLTRDRIGVGVAQRFECGSRQGVPVCGKVSHEADGLRRLEYERWRVTRPAALVRAP